MADWTTVNRVIEKMTGRPTPDREELNKEVDKTIADLRAQLKQITGRNLPR